MIIPNQRGGGRHAINTMPPRKTDKEGALTDMMKCDFPFRMLLPVPRFYEKSFYIPGTVYAN